MSFREELRHEYPLTENSVVFDIGGYKGEWAEIIWQRYHPLILVFEPVFPISLSFGHVYNIGLGGSSRTETIHVDRDKTGVFCQSGGEQDITIVDIVEFIKSHNIDHVDLMKINIEGMEYELLNRLIDTGWIENVRYLQVQFHRSMNSDRDMYLIQQKLRKTHFAQWQFRYVWESWQRKGECPDCGDGITAVSDKGYYCEGCGYERSI